MTSLFYLGDGRLALSLALAELTPPRYLLLKVRASGVVDVTRPRRLLAQRDGDAARLHRRDAVLGHVGAVALEQGLTPSYFSSN